MRRLRLAGLAAAAACADPPVRVAPTPTEQGLEIAGDPVESGSPTLAGGAVRVDAAGRLIAADPASDSVVVERDGVEQRVRFPAGSHPGAVVPLAGDRVAVVLRGAGAVQVLGLAPLAAGPASPVCARPRGMDVDADGALWVACAEGVLVRLDPDSGERRTVSAGPDLQDVVVDGDDLWVSRLRTAEVLRVDRDSGAILQAVVPPDARLIGGVAPDGTVAPDRTFVSRVGWRLVRHPDGGVWALHQRHQVDPVSLEPPADDPHAFLYGGREGCDAVVHGALTWIDRSGVRDDSPPIGLTVPFDLALDDRGGLHVAHTGPAGVPGRGEIARVSWGDGAACATVERGEQPIRGLMVAGVAWRDGHTVAPSTGPLLLPPWDALDEALRDEGRERFHLAGAAGLACASCHPDGADDAHTWDFLQIGPRRTQPLGGGIVDTAPFHWDGDLLDLNALFVEVGVSRMGHQPLQPWELEALGDWLDALPVPIVATDADPALVARGAEVFADPAVGCATCHSGDRYQGPGSHDVGTGSALQVPTLRGVAARLPLMHDGCAATLADRFDDPACGGGDAHGVTSGLSQADRDALIAFLETL